MADRPSRGTRREHTAGGASGAEPQACGTGREPPRAGSTRREGAEAGWHRVNLPPELADEYFIVRELGSGGEGFLLLVEDASGTNFVVKLYFPNLTFDENASTLLENADTEHVVRVVKTGEAEHDGSRFEVLEWCEHGSLGALLATGFEPDVRDVVAELQNALAHIHSLRLIDDPDVRLVHQDLKPDNVMVRTTHPRLDLVLGDFGLARLIAGSRHYTNRQQGSRPWAPPSGEAVTAGWDWWSLGMVVAEIAGGHHPFCVDGQWLSDAAISDLLSQGPVDLSDVEDDDVRHLCRGLLTRRTADRWGAAEVERWLAGESVAVATDAGGRRSRSVLFNGTEYTDPAALALAFQQDWDQAQERLIQRTDGGALSQEFTLLLASIGLAEAEQLLNDASHPPTRLANLLVELNPDLAPIYRGRDIRPAALARDLTGPQAEQAVKLIEDKRTGLAHLGVLTSWRHLEGMADAPQIERRLRRAGAFLANHKATLDRVSASAAITLRAVVYAAAVQPGKAEIARRSLAESDRTAAGKQSWWKQLAAEDDEFAPILALATEPFAREETNRDVAREQARRDAAKRQAEAAREADRREAEQRRLQALARYVAHTRRGVMPLGITSLLVGGVLAWLAFTPAHLEAATKWDPFAVQVGQWFREHEMIAVAYLGFGVLAITLAVRNKQPRTRAEWRVLQVVGVVGVALLPVVAPFALLYFFKGLQLSTEPQRDAGLRRWCLLSILVLVAFAVGLYVESRFGGFVTVRRGWPGGVEQWYERYWPGLLDPPTFARRYAWSGAVAIAVALVGFVLVCRSYHERSKAERVAMQVVFLIGAVALLPALPLILTGLAYLAVGLFYLIVGVLILIVVAVFIGGAIAGGGS